MEGHRPAEDGDSIPCSPSRPSPRTVFAVPGRPDDARGTMIARVYFAAVRHREGFEFLFILYMN